LQFFQLYADRNFKNLPGLPDLPIISSIKDVLINQDITKKFVLTSPAGIRIYSVGENCSGDFSSWCDYGWIEDSNG